MLGPIITEEMRERKAETLERRRRGEAFCGSDNGKMWLIENFGISTGAKSYFYMDEMRRFASSLEVTRCSQASVTLPNKGNFLNCNNLDRCTVRILAGLISGMEVTRVTKSRVFVSGVSVIQIDLCEAVDVYFPNAEQARKCKLVHANNVDLRVFVGDIGYELPTSIFSGDQQVSVFSPETGSYINVLSSSVKESGYLDLNAI